MKKLLYASLILIVSCTSGNNSDNMVSEKQFVSIEGINPTIKPGNNFFMHVNKTWYDTAKIADDQVGVGSYSFLNIPQNQLLENILEEVSGLENPKGSIEQKIGDFYASGMDTESINARGFEPIQPILDQIGAINSLQEMVKSVSSELKSNNQSFIGLRVSPDDENSSINIVYFSQKGLGLPDRDYYFKSDSSTLGIQKAYQTYLATLFELTGSNELEAQKAAEKVYAIEKSLAEAHKTRIERRVVKENFHKLTRAQQIVQQVDHQLDFDLGQLYVKRYFNEDAKKRVLDLVNNLQKAFENRINNLDWMSDSTKAKAKEKLYAITKKIGYPDEWREYNVSVEDLTWATALESHSSFDTFFSFAVT